MRSAAGTKMITIRRESSRDKEAIREVNEQAFPTPAEAKIVDALRDNCPGLLSLVAEEAGRIVGHILFSPSSIEGPGGVLFGTALGPMAVLPEHQRQGIGSMLMQSGLELLRQQGCPFVIVLGHPEYYPRFGFQRASRYRIVSQWADIPDEAFMVLFLRAFEVGEVAGTAKYRDEFNATM